LLDGLKRAVLYSAPALVGYTGAALLVGAAGAVAWPVATWWFGAVQGLHPMLAGFLVGVLGFATYLVFGFTLLVVIALVRNVTRLSVAEGTHRMRSWTTTRFFLYNLLVMTARYLVLPVTRTTRFNVLFYRAMGADIGKGVVINTAHVYDLNLLTIGDGATIGGSAVVMAHAGKGDELHTERVRIGEGASIGEGAIVFPGATIGDGATVAAGSVVPPGVTVPEGATVTGVPVDDGEVDRAV